MASEIVYVKLLSEPFPVWVPVVAEALASGQNQFRLIDYLHPDGFDEEDVLEFRLGSNVRCNIESRREGRRLVALKSI